MKITLIVIAALVVLIGIMYGVGYTLPIQHTATQTRAFEQSSEVIWNKISNVGEAKSWRSDVESITVTGPSTYKEMSNGDEVEYEITNSVPGVSMTTTIITKDLPYRGTWNFVIMPEGSGCRLTITENGEVFSPIFRFISTYFIGHDATMKTYLDDLAKSMAG